MKKKIIIKGNLPKNKKEFGEINSVISSFINSDNYKIRHHYHNGIYFSNNILSAYVYATKNTITIELY